MMTIAGCQKNRQSTFLWGCLRGEPPCWTALASRRCCKCMKTNKKTLVLRPLGAADFDLPAEPSCLSKQEGQEGGGGVRGPHTPLPLPAFLKNAQEGRRKVRKVVRQ